MDHGSEWLKEIAAKMNDAIENGTVPIPERLTARELLAKFGSRRRRDRINNHIRNELEKHGLVSEPDLAVGWIDSTVTISINSKPSETTGTHPVSESTHRISSLDAANKEPLSVSESTHRISSLDAANKEPLSVHPDKPLSAATTLMLLHDYSQLPVMTNSRTVKGVISWKSIENRLSLGRKCELVKQCMDPAIELPSDTPLFEAIAPIAQHEYVLVRGKDNSITGIITASDLSFQFMQLAGPFLFIGEIEGHLRRLIHGKFTLEEMRAASISEEKESINGSSDLTLGEYCRLLEDKENWGKLNLNIDRVQFIEQLHEVRQIRNDVMHFNPDPDDVSEDEIKKLRGIARFFEDLSRIGVI